MFRISDNGIITLNRGDTCKLNLLTEESTKKYFSLFTIEQLANSDIYFGVMEPNQAFENAIIRKKIHTACSSLSENNLVVSLSYVETEHMLPGKYYYQVKIKTNQCEVNTVIPKTMFYIVD